MAGVTLFGAWDKIIDEHEEAYCIAKIERLVGPLGPLPEGMREDYAEQFEVAAALKDVWLGPPINQYLFTIDPWRKVVEGLQHPPIPVGLLDFIEHLLVMDEEKRPTALEALKHPYLADISADVENRS